MNSMLRNHDYFVEHIYQALRSHCASHPLLRVSGTLSRVFLLPETSLKEFTVLLDL
jgi:hypothetical protein